jgi:hypothetical protein
VRLLQLGVEATDVVQQLEGEVVAGLLHRRRWAQTSEEPLGVRSVEFLGDPARGELGQLGVESAHEPCPVVADVGVALGQEAEHLGVVGGGNGSKSRCAQGSDGHRQGVVGVVLVRSPRRQHPDPGRQRRRHVDHVLARRHQLLGEQVAEPAR